MFVERLTSEQIEKFTGEIKKALSDEVSYEWRSVISKTFNGKIIMTFICPNVNWDTSIQVSDYYVDVTKSMLIESECIFSKYTHFMKDVFGKEYEEKFMEDIHKKLFE